MTGMILRHWAAQFDSTMTKKLIINVGRQFGCGGKAVAKMIGDALGIEVYDNELLKQAALSSGFREDLFVKGDERRSVLTLSSLLGPASFGTAPNNYINDNELFRIQSDVIRGIAERGSAIFIGRASDYVLRDMDCVDVFICAPMEFRVREVSQREGISPEAAESLIRKKDRGRASFYNFFTLGEWGVASNYDLCLDSSVLGLEGTAEVIIDYCRRRGFIE